MNGVPFVCFSSFRLFVGHGLVVEIENDRRDSDCHKILALDVNIQIKLKAMKLVLILYLSYAVMNAQSLNVAVIGAGASGLAAARILSRNGIQPVVLEKEQSVGGVWDYRVSTPDRPMYRGLRTNLPREIMAYREKPWPTPKGKKRYVECGLRFETQHVK